MNLAGSRLRFLSFVSLSSTKQVKHTPRRLPTLYASLSCPLLLVSDGLSEEEAALWKLLTDSFCRTSGALRHRLAKPCNVQQSSSRTTYTDSWNAISLYRPA